MPSEDTWVTAREQFIKAVIDNTSTIDDSGVSHQQIISDSFKRNNDSKWLADLFSHFSFNLIQNYFDNGPEYIDARIPESYDCWRYIINTFSFTIYDVDLKSKLFMFYKLWDEVMCDNWKYYEIATGRPNYFHFYGLSRGGFRSKDEANKFHKSVHLIKRMVPALKELTKYIASNYEINLNELSKKFEESI